MFEQIINSLLGDIGRPLLDFVLEYQLIISILVLGFGIFMIVKKRKAQTKDDENNENKENNK